MKCEIRDQKTDRLIEEVDFIIPKCQEDFCDECGDCLACYGSDPCAISSDGEHRFIRYRDAEVKP